MTKKYLLKASSFSLIAGLSLIGLGTGLLFDKGLIGLIIGTGVGLALFSIVIFRVIKRMDIYNKTEI